MQIRRIGMPAIILSAISANLRSGDIKLELGRADGKPRRRVTLDDLSIMQNDTTHSAVVKISLQPIIKDLAADTAISREALEREVIRIKGREKDPTENRKLP
ncbi:MAG: hypothetical protein WC527_04725 [Candidatus Margulisiibacteriota bacterium]